MDLRICPSRPHSVIAGIADFYFLSLLVGLLLAMFIAISGHPLSSIWWSIPLIVGAIATSAIYHRRFAMRVLWVSPGERLAGCTSDSGSKQWTNPFGRSRWALFLVILISLVVTGNGWDGIGMGRVYTIGEVLVKGFGLFLISLGFVKMGEGRLRWAAAPALAFFVAGAAVAGPGTVASEMTIGFFWVLGAANALVAGVYHFIRDRSVL